MTSICREKNCGSTTWRLEDGNWIYKGKHSNNVANKKKTVLPVWPSISLEASHMYLFKMLHLLLHGVLNEKSDRLYLLEIKVVFYFNEL